ncbi:hypothetical protein B9L19_14725 [Geobacillus thermocatenulatus]|uniref:Uncharacterized protein n=1 Tax=Geobacillus thermocatenulatus TaxID=33938 RepID=A0AA91TD87_9BACL|nr:hypothetical protein B9L19_14725 [Geobacillus thermocatenulatus]
MTIRIQAIYFQLEIIIVSTPWRVVFLVTVYDFQGGGFLCAFMHLLCVLQHVQYLLFSFFFV